MWTLKQPPLHGVPCPITCSMSEFSIDTLQLCEKILFHSRKSNEILKKNNNQIFPWQILSFWRKPENILTLKCHFCALLVQPGITTYKEERGPETHKAWVNVTANHLCVIWRWKPKIGWVWASRGDTFMNISLSVHFFLWNSLRRIPPHIHTHTLVELLARELVDVNTHLLQVSLSFHSRTGHLDVKCISFC